MVAVGDGSGGRVGVGPVVDVGPLDGAGPPVVGLLEPVGDEVEVGSVGDEVEVGLLGDDVLEVGLLVEVDVLEEVVVLEVRDVLEEVGGTPITGGGSRTEEVLDGRVVCLVVDVADAEEVLVVAEADVTAVVSAASVVSVVDQDWPPSRASPGDAVWTPCEPQRLCVRLPSWLKTGSSVPVTAAATLLADNAPTATTDATSTRVPPRRMRA